DWHTCSVLRCCLLLSEKKMIGVEAVENCDLCSFPSPLWARSVRPQGRQRPHRLSSREIVPSPGIAKIVSEHTRRRKGGIPEQPPPRENRSWGILSDCFCSHEPANRQNATHDSLASTRAPSKTRPCRPLGRVASAPSGWKNRIVAPSRWPRTWPDSDARSNSAGGR